MLLKLPWFLSDSLRTDRSSESHQLNQDICTAYEGYCTSVLSVFFAAKVFKEHYLGTRAISRRKKVLLTIE
jgi:hypothetical protein